MKQNGINNPEQAGCKQVDCLQAWWRTYTFFIIIFYSNLLYLYYLSIFIVMRFVHEPMARMIGATPCHVLTLIN